MCDVCDATKDTRSQDADHGTKSDETKQHLHPEADRYK